MSEETREYTGVVTRVVDGDTIDCDVSSPVDLPFGVRGVFTTPHRFRLAGVNCPELHGASREAGRAAAAFTEHHLAGKSVRLVAFKSADSGFAADSFGRWLARVYVGEVDFCRRLVDAGHAVPFMACAGPAGVTSVESPETPELPNS